MRIHAIGEGGGCPTTKQTDGKRYGNMQITCRGCGERLEWAEGVNRLWLCPKCNHFNFKAPPPVRIECATCHEIINTNSKHFEFMHCGARIGIPLPPLGHPIVEKVKESVRRKRTRAVTEDE